MISRHVKRAYKNLNKWYEEREIQSLFKECKKFLKKEYSGINGVDFEQIDKAILIIDPTISSNPEINAPAEVEFKNGRYIIRLSAVHNPKNFLRIYLLHELLHILHYLHHFLQCHNRLYDARFDPVCLHCIHEILIDAQLKVLNIPNIESDIKSMGKFTGNYHNYDDLVQKSLREYIKKHSLNKQLVSLYPVHTDKIMEVITDRLNEAYPVKISELIENTTAVKNN